MTEDVGLEETKRRLLGARLAFACVLRVVK